MNAFLKLASLIGRKLFTQGKPLTKKVYDVTKFVIREELKGKQTRRSFFKSMTGLLDELA